MPPWELSAPSVNKRSADNDKSLSPPPLKRKAQSTISKSAVANFFTPTSQKPKDRTAWTERKLNNATATTLLVGQYVPETSEDDPRPGRRMIAAFDLDSTLITSASGKKHAESAQDWKWWDSTVPMRLKDLYNKERYRIVILTNQAGLSLHPDPNSKGPKSLKDRVGIFKQKCSAVLAQLDIPLTIYAATENDSYRKPRTGMWTELLNDYKIGPADVDLEHSLFIGDAGGRRAIMKDGKAVDKDFSCSDRNLAANLGIRYMTPEEFFLGEKPREFVRDIDLGQYLFAAEEAGADIPQFERKNQQEIVIFCGPPGAGKSTFFWTKLRPLGFQRVNQDMLKSKDKCFKAATEFLRAGESVAIDNTNPEPDTRAQWIELARQNKVPIRCVWFKTPISLCEHNDAVRSLNKSLNPESRSSLPKIAFVGFASRFKTPKVKEGFDDVVEVDFKFRGTKEEYDIWSRYWL